MITITIKKEYLNTDSDVEIVFKNKQNILDLYSQLENIINQSNTSFEQVEKEITDIKTIIGTYANDDPIGELDDQLSVIRNLVIVKENLGAEIKRIDALETRVSTIENDGISFYIGTYKALDGDDKSSLPIAPDAIELDRAITEFPVVDALKYQEWQYKNAMWNKIGNVLDSHLHSQSSGISLQDVANQQDPKNLKLFFAKSNYVEKEITITPEIYGWKIINDLWTNANSFSKYKDKQIKATFNSPWNQEIEIIMNTFGTDTDKELFLSGGGSFVSASKSVIASGVLNIGKPDQLLFGITDTPATDANYNDITKIEIWDVITPAIKTIALVKK